MLAYKCDRCGKLFEEMKYPDGSRGHGKIAFDEGSDMKCPPPRMDICHECYVEFIDWFNKYYNEENGFQCGIMESNGHAYNCNDCPNKCDEWYQWDKEMKEQEND